MNERKIEGKRKWINEEQELAGEKEMEEKARDPD